MLQLLLLSLTSSAMLLPEDPNLFLEDRESARSIEWVRGQNEKTTATFGQTREYKWALEQMRDLYRAKDRVRFASYEHGSFWQHYQDEAHVQGQLRRMSPSEYKKDDSAYEVVLDFDQLSARDHVNYVYKGKTFLDRTSSRVLVELSKGGGDAVEIREFDLGTKDFVAGGFNLPEGKTSVAPIDENRIYVASYVNGDKDETKTDSGYARQIRLMLRGQRLDQAKVVFEVRQTDVGAAVYVFRDGARRETVFRRRIDTYHSEYAYKRDDGSLHPMPMPRSARLLDLRGGYAYVWTREAEGTLPGNSIVRMKLDAENFGEAERIYIAAPGVAMEDVSVRDEAVYVTLLENVRTKVIEIKNTAPNQWGERTLPFPNLGATAYFPKDQERDTDLSFLYTEDFLSPRVQNIVDDSTLALTAIKRANMSFDASNLMVEQNFATSKDGTRVPYFVVRSKDMEFNGNTPTLLNSYGGFEISLLPSYSGELGRLWIGKGHTYVLANIRGGGEFGPAWHHAALKVNRQNAYDDFIAVAEDLIARKMTSPRHLGISGGSNGGLLTGAVMVQRPELFNATVMQVPLLDMIRYPQLPAGASWIGEYGDPNTDADACAFWLKTSPYQNVKVGVRYPSPLITSSTKDDRVHPGHARKMAKRMLDQGHEVSFYENINGGHAGSANEGEEAVMNALEYTYLERRLK